jgi:hypothetical protein
MLKEYAEASGGETEIALPREIPTGRDFGSDLAPKGSIGIADGARVRAAKHRDSDIFSAEIADCFPSYCHSYSLCRVGRLWQDRKCLGRHPVLK